MANLSNMQLDLHGLFEHNSTFDYSDYDSCLPETSTSNVMAVFIPLIYSLAFFVGLLGNSLVLTTLWQIKQHWRVTNTFVLHLSLVNILLLLTMPFWAAQAANKLSFGIELCKLTTALFKICFYCSSFLLLCICLDRYLSIVHGVHMYSGRKPFQIHLSFAIIWFFSLLLSIPDWLHLTVNSSSQGLSKCVHSSAEWRMASHILCHLCFIISTVVIFYCCSQTVLQLKCDTQVRQKQKVVLIILVVVLVFFFCWTPFNITLFVDTVKHSDAAEQLRECQKSWWTAVNITAVLGVFHACLNPLIYIILCRMFRHWVIRVLTFKGCTVENGVVSLWESVVEDKDSSVQPEEKGSLHPMSDIGQSVERQQTDQMLC